MTDTHFTKDGAPIWGNATADEHIAYEKKILANSCVHFTGMRHQKCAKGIPYWPQGPQPCFPAPPSPHVCALREFLEGEALDNAAKALYEDIKQTLDEMTRRAQDGECIDCGKPITKRRQVGRCIYASPCGHRQGQGRLAKEDA